jgi:hypothetical protein
MSKFPIHKRVIVFGFALIITCTILLSFEQLTSGVFVKELFAIKNERNIYYPILSIGFCLIILGLILRKIKKP